MNSSRILITGAGGMLGTDVTAELKKDHQVLPLTRQELDITKKEQVTDIFKDYRPDIVINCAAFTRVDDCETQKEIAFQVNRDGPAILAQCCNELGARLIHISTDYVFDGEGKRPYTEDHPTNPQNVYGLSKLQGEIEVQRSCQDHIIIRTSWLFGKAGPNFITTMLKLSKEHQELRVVNDQHGSPTYTKDLAKGIRLLMYSDARGIFNCTNIGSCTWYSLCCYVFQQTNKKNKVIPVPTSQFPRPAKRPAYSVLSPQRFKSVTGTTLRPWQEAVKAFLSELDPSLA